MKDISDSQEDVARVVRGARTIAVLGAHPDPSRPAHYVPAYVASRGVRVLPVNPVYAGTTIFGETVRRSLDELAGIEIDIVDVFRRSSDVPTHTAEILSMKPLPRLVWLQLGIRHDETARALMDAGIEVVQDRCLLVDHRRFA